MLQPADATSPVRNAGLRDAITIIKWVQNERIKHRMDEMYHQILEKAKFITSGDSENKTKTQMIQIKKSNRVYGLLMYGPSY